jgi:hypothetical protein
MDLSRNDDKQYKQKPLRTPWISYEITRDAKKTGLGVLRNHSGEWMKMGISAEKNCSIWCWYGQKIRYTNRQLLYIYTSTIHIYRGSSMTKHWGFPKTNICFLMKTLLNWLRTWMCYKRQKQWTAQFKTLGPNGRVIVTEKDISSFSLWVQVITRQHRTSLREKESCTLQDAASLRGGGRGLVVVVVLQVQ